MNDDLKPISYQGFSNSLQRLLGSFFNPYPLKDKKLQTVATEDDGARLVFTFDDGRRLSYSAEGDCCSHSWIEHLTVPPDIAGTEVTGYAEQDMGEFEKDYDTIRVYQTSFATPKGEIIVEYRNASNGYYGGWLQGPIESWAQDEIESARKAER